MGWGSAVGARVGSPRQARLLCELAAGRRAVGPAAVDRGPGDLQPPALRRVLSGMGLADPVSVECRPDRGRAVDPDVDRCAIVDNTGTAIGEEYTLAAAVKFILSKKLGEVVVNMSTSRASEDIARYYNCPFTRTKVGEINVAEVMAKNEAVIGGEGNGGVILPELHLGRDAPAAIALTIQQLLEFGGTMHELFKSLPQYKIVKQKINIEGKNPDKLLNLMAEKHQDKQINFLDGLKIDTKETWVHLRKSNTEPIIRVMAEAPTENEAKMLADRYHEELNGLEG